MKETYKEIPSSLLKRIGGNVWSFENMEAHGAEGRQVTYIGSRQMGYLDNDPQKGRLIFDYYEDSKGDYWYKTRALLPNGSLVSMDVYIFGKRLNHRSSMRRRKTKK